MTARQLHTLACQRNATLKANAKHSFALSGFARWLDQQVQAGLLQKHGHHYQLTNEGLTVASILNDLTIGD